MFIKPIASVKPEHIVGACGILSLSQHRASYAEGSARKMLVY